MNKSEISASLMCAKPTKLDEYLRIFSNEGIDYLHIDVMDGHFVPNLALGTDYLEYVRNITDINLDFHFMTTNPIECLSWFKPRENDVVCVHYESVYDIQKVLDIIRSNYGCAAFLALNPGTSVSVVETLVDSIDGVLIMTINPGFAGRKLLGNSFKKVEKLNQLLSNNNYNNIVIAVDGNMSNENAAIMHSYGASRFVVGSSSIFGGEDTVGLIKEFKESIKWER